MTQGPLLVLLPVDPAVCQRGVQRAVAAAELRHQRQLNQRRHRVISAQDRVNQVEGRLRPGEQVRRGHDRGQRPLGPAAVLQELREV
jgi:hypothetical protein